MPFMKNCNISHCFVHDFFLPECHKGEALDSLDKELWLIEIHIRQQRSKCKRSVEYCLLDEVFEAVTQTRNQISAAFDSIGETGLE